MVCGTTEAANTVIHVSDYVFLLNFNRALNSPPILKFFVLKLKTIYLKTLSLKT